MKSKAYIKIFITTFKITFLPQLFVLLLVTPCIFHVAVIQKVGKYMYDWCIDPFLDQSSGENFWLVLLQKKGLLNNIAIDMGLISAH